MDDPIGSITVTDHAREMLIERGIEEDWVIRTLRDPDVLENDPKREGRVRAFRAVPEREERVWRVVFERSGSTYSGQAVHIMS
jgi:hypothetical protein